MKNNLDKYISPRFLTYYQQQLIILMVFGTCVQHIAGFREHIEREVEAVDLQPVCRGLGQ